MNTRSTVRLFSTACLASSLLLPPASAGAQAADDELVPFEPSIQAEEAGRTAAPAAAAAVGSGAVRPPGRATQRSRAAATLIGTVAMRAGGALALRSAAPGAVAAAMRTDGLSAVTASWVAREQAKDGAMGCRGGGTDPLVFDLAGKGVRPSARSAAFDINGDGRLESINDIGPGTGLLVFDADHDGVSGSDARELLGDSTDLEGSGSPTGFCNGFQALRALALKGLREGILQETDLYNGRLGGKALAGLEEVYGLKMKVGSVDAEPVSLARAGVKAIYLRGGGLRSVNNFDGRGNVSIKKMGAAFVRKNGTTGSYEDIAFAARQPSEALVAGAAGEDIAAEPPMLEEGVTPVDMDSVVAAFR